MVAFVVLIVLLGLAGAGYFLYDRFLSAPTVIDDGFDQSKAYQEISVQKAKDLIDSNQDLIVVDVSNEYVNGHIPAAVNVSLNELEENLSEFDMNDEILVYARFNMNSIEAAEIFSEAGFKNVFRMIGEYDAWLSEGYQIETGEGSGMKKDSDKDGLSDKEEDTLGTDPNNPDTDEDGLLDGEEVKLGTDITNPDSDQDGFLDGEEVDSGFDPNAKPDQAQAKTKELEEIDLEMVFAVSAEGKAGRYMSKGKYFLDIEATLPKTENGNNYIAFLVNDNTGEKIRTGELKYQKDIGDQDEEIKYSQYSLNYQTDQDYWGFYLVEIGIQEEIDTVTVLRGEFERSE
jgi:rhodanese-related sulfurtransferase